MSISRSHHVSIISGASRDSSQTQIADSVSTVLWKELLFFSPRGVLLQTSASVIAIWGKDYKSSASIDAYIALFPFCLLISLSRLLIIPLHKALHAGKVILPLPKQLRTKTINRNGTHMPLRKSVIYLSNVEQ